VGPIHTSLKGNKYLVVFTDFATRWPEAFAVSSITAPVIADLLFKQIICRHGAVKVLLSDRGTNFLSKLVQELCKLIGTEHHKTSSYHPQCNGLCEKFNGTLIQGISMYVDSNQLTWDEFVEPVLFSYRSTPCDSTGYSPFMLLYGRQPKLPIDIALLAQWDKGLEPQKHLEQIVEKLKIIQPKSVNNLLAAQAKMKGQHDKRLRSHRFTVGDKVWLYVPAHKKHLTRKLQHLWKGPYIIHQQVPQTNGTFRLKSLQGNKILAPVHASRLKPFTDSATRPIGCNAPTAQDDIPIDDNPVDDDIIPAPPTEPPNLQDDSTAPDAIPPQVTPKVKKQRVFAIERIVGKRKAKGKVQYKVKWAGYPMSRCSWLNPERILDKVQIDDFEQSQPLISP
jgi:hypothetical protein